MCIKAYSTGTLLVGLDYGSSKGVSSIAATLLVVRVRFRPRYMQSQSCVSRLVCFGQVSITMNYILGVSRYLAARQADPCLAPDLIPKVIPLLAPHPGTLLKLSFKLGLSHIFMAPLAMTYRPNWFTCLWQCVHQMRLHISLTRSSKDTLRASFRTVGWEERRGGRVLVEADGVGKGGDKTGTAFIESFMSLNNEN